MFYDVEVTAEQLRAAADWAEEGQAPVRLLADDSILLAGQGDERAAWDASGEPASDEYLAAAPLDPSPRARARGLAEQISVIAGKPAEVGGAHAAAQSALAGLAVDLATLILHGETPPPDHEKCLEAGSCWQTREPCPAGAALPLGERAGPVGREMASQLIDRVSATITGLPMSSREQRSAIARLTAGGLGAYAVQEQEASG